MYRVRSSGMVLCLLAAVSGCAEPGPLLSRRTTVGTLKTSVSHLQFENEQLRKQLASVESDSRQIEERLVQEEAANGELTARLDDARSLLSQRGVGPGDDTFASGSAATRNTLPAARSTRRRRKPPFAQIPGRLDTLVPENEQDDADFGASPGASGPGGLGPQSRLDRPRTWLPVAGDLTDPPAARR